MLFWIVVAMILLAPIIFILALKRSEQIDSAKLSCYFAFMRWCEAGERGDYELQKAFERTVIDNVEHLKSLTRKKDRPALDFVIECVKNDGHIFVGQDCFIC